MSDGEQTFFRSFQGSFVSRVAAVSGSVQIACANS